MLGVRQVTSPGRASYLVPSPSVQFYKADLVRKETMWRTWGVGWGGEGDSDGWLFCGCLAGDLLEEWIQK